MSWLGGVGILHCLAQARPYRPLVWSGSHQSCGCPVAAFDPAVLLPDPRVCRLLDPLGRPAISISMDVQDCSDGARGGVEIKSLSLVLPTRGPSLHLRLRGRPLHRKLHLVAGMHTTRSKYPSSHSATCNENQRFYLSVVACTCVMSYSCLRVSSIREMWRYCILDALL